MHFAVTVNLLETYNELHYAYIDYSINVSQKYRCSQIQNSKQQTMLTIVIPRIISPVEKCQQYVD